MDQFFQTGPTSSNYHTMVLILTYRSNYQIRVQLSHTKFSHTGLILTYWSNSHIPSNYDTCSNSHILVQFSHKFSHSGPILPLVQFSHTVKLSHGVLILTYRSNYQFGSDYHILRSNYQIKVQLSLTGPIITYWSNSVTLV